MKNIQLTLSLEETNLLLESLSRMPYGQVAELVNKIQQMAQHQLTPENGKTGNQQSESKN